MKLVRRCLSFSCLCSESLKCERSGEQDLFKSIKHQSSILTTVMQENLRWPSGDMLFGLSLLDSRRNTAALRRRSWVWTQDVVNHWTTVTYTHRECFKMSHWPFKYWNVPSAPLVFSVVQTHLTLNSQTELMTVGNRTCDTSVFSPVNWWSHEKRRWYFYKVWKHSPDSGRSLTSQQEGPCPAVGGASWTLVWSWCFFVFLLVLDVRFLRSVPSLQFSRGPDVKMSQ